VERQVHREMATSSQRLTAEEIAVKQKLILKIGRYEKSKHYGEQLRSLGFTFGKALQSRSQEELEDQLVQMKASLNSDPNSNLIGTGIFMVTGFAEQMSQNPKIKEKCDLQGWSSNLKANVEFEKIVDLLSLEYESLSSLSPEVRLLLILATSGITVAATNAHISTIRKLQAERAQVELENTNQQSEPKSESEPEPEPITTYLSDTQYFQKPNLVLQVVPEAEVTDDDPEPELEPEPERDPAQGKKTMSKMTIKLKPVLTN
jgi:hypothetical protein